MPSNTGHYSRQDAKFGIVVLYLCVFARDNPNFGCGVAALWPFVVSSLSNHVVKSVKTVPFHELRLKYVKKRWMHYTSC
jgi:hypothetical protein